MYSHSVSLSNSVVTGCKPKVVRFLRVQISDGFRRTRILCFVIPLSQHSLHLICKMCTKHPRPTRASIISSSHLGLSSKRPPRLAMHPFRRFVKAGMSLATRSWEIWAHQSLRRSFRLSIPWIFTAHQPLQLSTDEEVHVMSRLFGGQASDWRYRRQTWSRYSADCCLIARQPAGTWWSFGRPAMMWPQFKLFRFCFFSLGGNVHVSSQVHAKVTPSNAIKGWQIIFSRSTKSEHAKTWRLLVCTLWRRYLKGNRVWLHSFERKLSALSNAISGKVVRRIGRELFDLGWHVFLITLYSENGPFLLPLDCFSAIAIIV